MVQGPSNSPAGRPVSSNLPQIADKRIYTNGKQSSHTQTPRVGQQRVSVGALQVSCSWLLDHQLGISASLILLLSVVHTCFPQARSHTRKFFEISGGYGSVDLYIRSWDDAYYVGFWIVVLNGARAVVVDHVMKPLAARGGIRTEKRRMRFAEQGWIFIYYLLSWSAGMYIYYGSNYWLNLREMWAGFPVLEISSFTKHYYLIQCAVWLHLLFVLQVEKHRKDHNQMVTHHIFTLALLFTSYAYYQTRVGNVILCLMDISDFILALTKILNYLRLQTACDAAFGAFLVSWFFARHVFYLAVCYSIYSHVGRNGVFEYGCYSTATSPAEPVLGAVDRSTEIWSNIVQSFADPGGVVCFNRRIQYAFLGLLVALQVLLLIWFRMAIKVAYGVVTGKGAQDSRSDDESDDEEEGNDKEQGKENSLREALVSRKPSTASRTMKNGQSCRVKRD